ncbi:MAG: hypothetical protein HRT88_14835 [Lentisphaeraceae bacterium]|nr:hypothetical protein [Lentisphaeraceae bacterium]
MPTSQCKLNPFSFPLFFIKGDKARLQLTLFDKEGLETHVRVEESSSFIMPKTSFTIAAGERSRELSLPIEFIEAGKYKLRIFARNSNGSEDAFEQDIEVLPHGFQKDSHITKILEGNSQAKLQLTADPAHLQQQTHLLIYPGMLSEYLCGVDELLRQPHGCFEQTSSTAYPNIMVLKYLKKSGSANKEIELKAINYLRYAAKRLSGFEVKGGGFSLYGKSPAVPWLSAYGLMQFHEMKQFISIDPKLLSRTWQFIRSRLDSLTEAQLYFTLRAAQKCGYYLDKKYLAQAKSFIKENKGGQYAKVQALLFLSESDTEHLEPLFMKLYQQLNSSSPLQGRGLNRSYGKTLNTEIRANLLIAAYQIGIGHDIERDLVNSIQQARMNYGWGSTFATVSALQALSLYSKPARGSLQITSQGKNQTYQVDGTSQDVIRLTLKAADVHLKFSGKGKLTTKMLLQQSLPWGDEAMVNANSALSAKITFDRDLIVGSIPLSIDIRARKSAFNPMLKLPLPSCFSIGRQTLKKAVNSGSIRHFEINKNELTLYLNDMQTKTNSSLNLIVSCQIPGSYNFPEARVYEYYAPEFYQSVKTQTIDVH